MTGFKEFWKVRIWILLVVASLSNLHRFLDWPAVSIVKLPLYVIMFWLLELLIAQYQIGFRGKKAPTRE